MARSYWQAEARLWCARTLPAPYVAPLRRPRRSWWRRAMRWWSSLW